MNLLVSFNWLREYLPGLKATPEEVAGKLSLHAFSVERWRRMDENLDGVVVGEILEFHKHPNADKLSVAKVDVGRDRPIQLIFGQMVTMQAGNKVPVALAPTTLPGGRKIEKAKIRGEESQGMLCLDQELGLLEAGVSIRHFDASVKNGTPIAKALELDDTIFEVEITTNRPDALGMIGLAREVGAIFNVKCKIKNVKLPVARDFMSRKGGTQGAALQIRVEVPKLCPRYIAVVMEGIKIAPSPWWMQRRLLASGVRPINNIVDITNYVLLEWGQPCHAFDFDKLVYTETESPSRRRLGLRILSVRMAKKGEKILALDGQTHDLDENILVIADAKKPVAIAGIMGGEGTGVHSDTSRIVLEIANFDPVAVRRGEHQLGLSSDSSVRFNKGLPVQLPEYAMERLVQLAVEIAGGKVTGMVDKKSSLDSRLPAQAGVRGNDKRVSVSPREVAERIGVDIAPAQMKKYLTSLGFKVTGGTKKWSVVFPYWREVEAGGLADVVEEVARMYGYHRLPGVLPHGALPGEAPNIQFVQEHAVKEVLRGAGYTELYTYSFASADEVERAGFDPQRDALALSNPLSSELTHLRPWLGISLLKAIAQNEKEQGELQLFELSSEYHPRPGDLPDERQKLIVSCSGLEKHEGGNFYTVKGAAEHLAEALALPEFAYEKVGSIKAPWVKHYHPSRVLLVKSGRDIIGVVGELHPQLLRAYGIEHRVAFLEWEMRVLYPLLGKGRVYEPPRLYPPVKRDIAFVVAKEKEYAAIHSAIFKADSLIQEVELFDQYEGKEVLSGHHSLAFHVVYASSERTLTAQEADRAHEKLGKMLEERFSAKVRE